MRRGADTTSRSGTVAALATFVGAAVLVAACGIGAGGEAADGASVAPSSSVPPAVAGTAEQERQALGAAGLQVSVPQVPFRPAESPTLAAAPRGVYQVKLPDDQAHGFFVIYELPSPQAATAAAQEQVAYIESGPGRVQFPADARFVLRQVGTTLVFYPWSPGAATDPRAPEIATALSSVGIPFQIRA